MKKLSQHNALKFLLVFLLAVLQYANTGSHDYAWDDAIVVTENTRVQKGLSDVPELFENIKTSETQNRYGYRPISLLSFATDVELFGLNAKAAHKTNILLYAILCILILYFLNTFFPAVGWTNFFIAILFVVHPLHTEVVANIKSRDEILAMFFGILGLVFFFKAYTRKKVFFYLFSGMAFILSFLSKESGITFCGIAVLIPWYYSEGGFKKIKWRAMVPALLFLALLLAIRVFVYSDSFFQSTDWELVTKGLFHQDGFVGNPLVDSGWLDKLAMAFYLIIFYLYKFFWSYPLIHDYSYNQLQVFTWVNWQVWGAVFMCLVLFGFGLKGLVQRKSYGFGIAFFLVTSSIYLHVIQPAPDIFGERFLFVPSLGICIVLITLYNLPIKQHLVNLTIVLLLVPASIYTYERNKVWRNNETLLKTDLAHLDNCARANYNYALMIHAEYYESAERDKDSLRPEILKAYERTVAITDRLLNAEVDLSAAYMEFGMPDKAYPMFISLTERYPDLSTPYVQIGKYHMSFKQYAEALGYFEKALEKGMANSDYHYLMSICQFNTGKREEAIATLLQGEKLGVSSPAYFSLEARLYMKMNQVDFAIFSIERGLRQFPSDTQLKEGLIKLRAIKGKAAYNAK
ncbi:MAG: hypothetical protein ACI9UR_002332 [Bacteroidia bacterium]